MNLIIDNSNLFAGGGIQVAISFLKDLKNLNFDHTYHVIQSPNMAKAFGEVDFPNNFKFYKLSENAAFSKKTRIQQVKSLEDTIKPDCIFTVFGPSYHKSNYPKLVGFAIPHIIYPDSPYFEKLSIKDKLYSKLLAYFKSYCFKKYSDALVFETQDAANIYKEKYSFNKHVFVANNTLNEIFYCNNSAYFCEATNPTAYAEAIINLYNNPEKGKDLIEKGEINLKRFGTSLDRAKKYLNFIEQISNKK